jgi:predicted metal-dependent hydrolase
MDIYTPEFDNLPKFRLRIRKMKTRWGVCNRSSMTVTLNSLLIHKRVDLIDYVICHELSHFEHMDHSPAFWKEVSRHYKDYKKARKELNS